MAIIVYAFVLIIMLLVVIVVVIAAALGGTIFVFGKALRVPVAISAFLGAAASISFLVFAAQNGPFSENINPRRPSSHPASPAPEPPNPTHYVTKNVSLQNINGSLSGKLLTPGDCIFVSGGTPEGKTKIQYQSRKYVIGDGGIRKLSPGTKCPVTLSDDEEAFAPYFATITSTLYLRQQPSSKFISTGWSVSKGDCLKVSTIIGGEWALVISGKASGYVSVRVLGNQCEPR